MHLIGATLTLERVTVTGGTVTGITPAGDGGGILALSPSRLTLTRATVSGNTAVQSGGIANGHRGGVGGTAGGEVLMVDSTVSGNTVSAASGGGMGAGGIGNINAALSVVNSTISGNATAVARQDSRLPLPVTHRAASRSWHASPSEPLRVAAFVASASRTRGRQSSVKACSRAAAPRSPSAWRRCGGWWSSIGASIRERDGELTARCDRHTEAAG